MGITVKGVEVRPEEINLEVQFWKLTPEGQQRVFLENKEDFMEEALSSRYSTVRRILWEPKVLKRCSVAELNTAIKVCCKSKCSPTDIMALINAVGSELSEGNRELIACASCTHLKGWTELKVLIAEDEKTPLEILAQKEMFTFAAVELVQSRDARLFDAIVQNPNFRVDEDIEKEIKEFAQKARSIIRARLEELKSN